jgi:hypothetical protein
MPDEPKGVFEKCLIYRDGSCFFCRGFPDFFLTLV